MHTWRLATVRPRDMDSSMHPSHCNNQWAIRGWVCSGLVLPSYPVPQHPHYPPPPGMMPPAAPYTQPSQLYAQPPPPVPPAYGYVDTL